MRLIPLSHGQFAQVDDCDYEWLMGWKWFASWDGKGRCFYAQRSPDRYSMHRLILGLEKGEVREVDHVRTGETLNNQRSNLRLATRSQNNANRRIRSDNTSGYKGVSWNDKRKLWYSQIMKDGKAYPLGHFWTPQEAHAVYCRAAAEMFGEFARTS